MAVNPYLTKVRGQAMLDSLVDALDVGGAGTIKVYSGTQPTNADTAIVAQVLLATLTFSATAFGAASSADPTVATASAITSDSSADNTNTATWARWASGDGTTVLDCSVGTSSADIIFNSVAFVSGATIAISSLTVTQPLHV